MATPFITLRDASFGHGDRRILEHVTFAVEALDFVALLGPNGAGKTTLLRGIVRDRWSTDSIERRARSAYGIARALAIFFLAGDPHGECSDGQFVERRPAGHDGYGTHGPRQRVRRSRRVAFRVSQGVFARILRSGLAIVFGKRAAAWDTLLYLVSGVTIAFGVIMAGPIVTFGFLLIPPLAARLFTRHMIAFSPASAIIGGVTSFAGAFLEILDVVGVEYRAGCNHRRRGCSATLQ
jgi:hypothetical protein